MGLQQLHQLRHRMKFFSAGHVKDLDSRNFVRLRKTSSQGRPKFVLKVARMASGTWLAYRIRSSVAVLQCCSVAVSKPCLFRGNQDRIGIKCQMGCNACCILCSYIQIYLDVGCSCNRLTGGAGLCATLLTCCRFATLGSNVPAWAWR